MGRGICKVILVGRLGADPEVKYTSSGTAITSLSVATSESWTDKQSGEKQERTEWHRVKLFGRLAEIAGEYLKKGREVYVEGTLRTDKYTDKQGIERYSTDIVASEMQMLGGGSEGGNSGRNGGGGGERRDPSSAQSQRQAPQQQRQGHQQGQQRSYSDASAGDRAMGGFDDDDIPFRQHRHRSYF